MPSDLIIKAVNLKNLGHSLNCTCFSLLETHAFSCLINCIVVQCVSKFASDHEFPSEKTSKKCCAPVKILFPALDQVTKGVLDKYTIDCCDTNPIQLQYKRISWQTENWLLFACPLLTWESGESGNHLDTKSICPAQLWDLFKRCVRIWSSENSHIFLNL